MQITSIVTLKPSIRSVALDKDQKFWLLFWTIVVVYFLGSNALHILSKYLEIHS
jgi:hypothetical protein